MIRKMVMGLDDILHNVIDKGLFPIGVFVVLCISFLIRWHLMPITCLSDDYNSSLLQWIEYYRANGIIGGLAGSVGNYYVPYNLFLAVVAFMPGEPWMYIAGLSVIADYVGAFFIYQIAKELVRELGKSEKIAAMAALAALLLPAALFNGALWKQCDSVYTCFLIISIYCAVKKRYNLALVMLGISFVFKLQAIYLLPLFVLLYIFKEKHLSFIHFFWIPIMYLIGGLPAVFSGRRAFDVYDCYYHQTSNNGFDAMEIGMPNIYRLGLTDYPALCLPAVLITICIFVFMACVIQKKGQDVSRTYIVYLAIWSLWTCVMFLPAQHERYNFPVLILLTAFYIVTDIKKCWPAIIINAISCYQYGNYLFQASMINPELMAVCHIAAYVYVTYDIISGFYKNTTKCEAKF